MIACNDAEVLQEIRQLLVNSTSEVSEAGEDYILAKDSDPVPDWFYEKLQKDFEKYGRGELKTRSWEQVKEGIKRKNGF